MVSPLPPRSPRSPDLLLSSFRAPKKLEYGISFKRWSKDGEINLDDCAGKIEWSMEGNVMTFLLVQSNESGSIRMEARRTDWVGTMGTLMWMACGAAFSFTLILRFAFPQAVHNGKCSFYTPLGIQRIQLNHLLMMHHGRVKRTARSL